MKTLLCLINKRAEAVSFWRAAGPLTALPKDCGWQVKFMDDKPDWVDVAQCDALLLIRPANPGMVSLFNVAQELGKPVWVDFDDDLLNIPPSNPCAKYYKDESVRNNVRGFLEHADVVTVSTLGLANSFARHMPKPARILPNAWHRTLFKGEPKANVKNKTILWRGSNTHDEDLLFHMPAIAAIHSKHPDWTWHFAGYAHWQVEQAIAKERLRVIPPTDFITYMRLANNAIKPAVAIVPLKNHKFNQCKSNIAWIEGTYLGAAVVCPDMPEWQNPGACLYNPDDPLAMADAFDEAAGSIEESVSKSWAAITDGLTVDRTNQTRVEILNAMVG